MKRNKQTSRGLFSVLSCLVVALAISGCGSVQHKVNFHNKYLPQPGTQIEVGKVTNETGETFDINVEQMLTDALAEQLRKKAILWEGTSGSKLVLSSKIVEYAKGSALKRWFLPGWGSTVLTIQCDLKEGSKVVGSAEARRTVSFGGGYSINAWKNIFAGVAKDVVKDLRSKIPK